jgi:hypothetical protein
MVTMHLVVGLTMSIFLILPLSLLCSGAIVSLLLARYRPRYSIDTAAIFSVLALAVWVFAGRDLPILPKESGGQLESGFALGRFIVDEPAWWVSFSILLLLVSSLVLMVTASRTIHSESQLSFKRVSAASLSLLVVGGVLLSIWASTMPALATGWTLVVLAWVPFAWVARKDRENNRKAIVRAALMLFSLLFLGFAAASQSDLSTLFLAPENWSDPAKVWAMLGATALIGAFPLHWWRPSPGRYVIGTTAIVYLAPSVAGAHFLARLAGGEADGVNVFSVLLTTFGLLGLVYSIGICWSNPDKRLAIVGALALSQISLILLATAWANTATVILLIQVLALAIGGLFLGIAWPIKVSNLVKIPMWFQVAAIAGLPLTAGFIGLSSLYTEQITLNRYILAIAIAIILMPVLAAAILLVWEEGASKRTVDLSKFGQAWIIFSLSLPALGLFALPLSTDVIGAVLSWILILLSTLGAIAMSWYALKKPDVREAVSGGFHISLSWPAGTRVLRSIAVGANLFIREAAAILEGEGGMLWLLVLVVILWLARIG